MMTSRRIEQLRFSFSGLTLLFCLSILLAPFNLMPLERLEQASYDWRMTSFQQTQQPDPRVVIVDIDERSLAQEGQWPWPRSRIAALLQQLDQFYQVSAIGFDILFPEATRTPREDQIFKQALLNSNALMAELFQLEQTRRSLTVAQLSPAPSIKNHSSAPVAWGYLGNNASLITGKSAGHISIDVDQDGKSRSLPPVIQWQNGWHSTLSLALLQRLFQLQPITINRLPGLFAPAQQIEAPPFKIPLNSAGRALIPYRGAAGSYLYIPASDILNQHAPLSLLQDRIVLIGSSATGLYDMIATPWSKHYPGVEVHATLISAILDGTLITEPAYANTIVALTCVVLFFATMLAYQHLSLPITQVLCLFMALLWLTINLLAWHQLQLALPISLPILLLLALTLINTPALAILANQQRQRISSYFKDYVPGTVVEQLIQGNGAASTQPQRCEMSVMFVDIRGFTSISEKLTPIQLADLMQRVLSPITQVIHNQGGTIDKYMGDAVMAFWGAPLPQSNHAIRAVNAALQIQQAVDTLNTTLTADGYPIIKVGIGINSGYMTVGNMGSNFRVSYTVIGDAVNIASRLEGLTKEYNVGILLGQTTANMVNTNMRTAHLGQSAIKGREKPVHLYTPADSGIMNQQAGQGQTASAIATREVQRFE